MKNHISGQLAHSLAIRDMKSEGIINLSEKKVISELPVRLGFSSKPKLAKDSPSDKCFTNFVK